jgi:SAM-dependent methyltransferase
MTTSTSTHARQAAASLWGTHPAGTTLAGAPRGTSAFYDEMRATRYRVQPWHPALLASLPAGRRLLEVGCGAGTDLAMLGARFDYAVGVDLAPHGAALARGSLRHWGVAGTTLATDGERLPFADASFDLAYSFGVIHHTDHPEAVVAEIARVLEPGGRVVVGLYHRWSLFAARTLATWVLKGGITREPWHDWLARCEGGAVQEGVRPRMRLYTRGTARTLLAGAGFTGLRTRVLHAGLAPAAAGFAPLGWYVLVTGRKG